MWWQVVQVVIEDERFGPNAAELPKKRELELPFDKAYPS